MNKLMLILIAAMFTLSCEDCDNDKCNGNPERDKCRKEKCRSRRRW